MAITKILYINENKDWTPKHLKTALNYITVPEKTGDGRYVSGVGCMPESAFEQMIETKKFFAKTDKRQAYHIMISFEENNINPDTAFEFMGRFVNEYLKGEYEAVYAVHVNTDHIHGHIVFNSVNAVTGKKYRYEKGDWAKYIQPITNRLCEEYGFSTIKINDEIRGEHKGDLGLTDFRSDKLVWSDMIRRDIDAAVIKAMDFDSFLMILEDKGYEIKQGKYLSLRPPGMVKFRRTQTLGENYSTDSLKTRIETESLKTYQSSEPKILRVNIPYHLKRAKLSGIQKEYFKKLYETGKLKRKPYSEAWRYKEDIQRFNKLQAEYLFLAKYEIHTREDLERVGELLSQRKSERGKEKGKIYKQRARFKPLFDIVDRLDYLKSFENSYQKGDSSFENEHAEYERLMNEITKQGYTPDDLRGLRDHYKVLLSEHTEKYKGLSKDIRIYNGMTSSDDTASRFKEKQRTEEKIHKKTR